MNSEKTLGIIFSSKPFFESDQLLEVFCENLGRVSLLARYVNRPNQNNKGALQPLTLVRLDLFKGRSFWILRHSDIQHSFSAIRDDFNKIQLSFYFCSLIKQSTSMNQTNPPLFGLLSDTLHLVSSAMPSDFEFIKASFQTRFLQIEGLMEGEGLTSDSQFKAAFEAYTGTNEPNY